MAVVVLAARASRIGRVGKALLLRLLLYRIYAGAAYRTFEAAAEWAHNPFSACNAYSFK